MSTSDRFDSSIIYSDKTILNNPEIMKRYECFKKSLFSQINEQPVNFKSHLSDELLEELAFTLLDPRVKEIISLLETFQLTRENTFWDERNKSIQEIKNKFDQELNNFWCNQKPNKQQFSEQIKILAAKYNEEINKIDQDIVKNFDENIKVQQENLIGADIPGFSLTNNDNEIHNQAILLQIIKNVYATAE